MLNSLLFRQLPRFFLPTSALWPPRLPPPSPPPRHLPVWDENPYPLLPPKFPYTPCVVLVIFSFFFGHLPVWQLVDSLGTSLCLSCCEIQQVEIKQWVLLENKTLDLCPGGPLGLHLRPHFQKSWLDSALLQLQDKTDSAHRARGPGQMRFLIMPSRAIPDPVDPRLTVVMSFSTLPLPGAAFPDTDRHESRPGNCQQRTSRGLWFSERIDLLCQKRLSHEVKWPEYLSRAIL